jgi:hypothetical protein
MFVIERNGKTIVLTGWRAWLAGLVAFIVLAALLSITTFVLFGIAITLVGVFLVVAPAAAGVALLASVFQSRKP